jgi:peptidoglycan/xylan/chitin deacetylase (PgdA/CDA1 family)
MLSIPRPGTSLGLLACLITLISGIPQTHAAMPPLRLPILMFHYIEDPAQAKDRIGKELSVSPAHLAQDLDWMASHGYRSVGFAQVQSGMLPLKPVMLTFDDGYEDAYVNALPALQSRGMTGTFYIITGKVGLPGYMTWDQIRIMQRDGMEIGAHTVHHPDLSRLTPEKQKEEIGGSMDALEKELAMPVLSIAYPSGKYDKDSLREAAREGIPYGVTTHRGIAGTGSRLELPRLRVKDSTSMARLLEPPSPKSTGSGGLRKYAAHSS